MSTSQFLKGFAKSLSLQPSSASAQTQAQGLSGSGGGQQVNTGSSSEEELDGYYREMSKTYQYKTMFPYVNVGYPATSTTMPTSGAGTTIFDPPLMGKELELDCLIRATNNDPLALWAVRVNEFLKGRLSK